MREKKSLYKEKNKENFNQNIGNKKNKSTLILQLLLLFFICVFIGMIIFDFHSRNTMEGSLNQVVEKLDKKIEENKEIAKDNENNVDQNSKVSTVTKAQNMSVRIGNSTVLGKIKIDKIGIEYPIIEYKNDDSLWKSICKISNNSINGTGNLCLAGHNMRNMTMFAKIKRLKVDDIVEITNIYGDKYIYKVYESYYIDPSDVEVLKNTSEPIVTMITCNNTSNKRLIVRARLQ